jgi:hypothetical protein
MGAGRGRSHLDLSLLSLLSVMPIAICISFSLDVACDHCVCCSAMSCLHVAMWSA